MAETAHIHLILARVAVYGIFFFAKLATCHIATVRDPFPRRLAPVVARPPCSGVAARQGATTRRPCGMVTAQRLCSNGYVAAWEGLSHGGGYTASGNFLQKKSQTDTLANTRRICAISAKNSGGFSEGASTLTLDD